MSSQSSSARVWRSGPGCRSLGQASRFRRGRRVVPLALDSTTVVELNVLSVLSLEALADLLYFAVNVITRTCDVLGKRIGPGNSVLVICADDSLEDVREHEME